MKVTVVNAYGHSNRGDSVLLSECINDIMESYGTNGSLSVLLHEGQVNHPNVHSCRRLGNVSQSGLLGMLVRIYVLSLLIVGAIFRNSKIFSFLPSSQKLSVVRILESDLIVSAPGGYIHDTNMAYYIALLHLWIPVRFGRSVVLAPQSYGPIKSRFGKWLTKYTLSRATFICCREQYSFDFLVKDLGLNKERMCITGDSAFWNILPKIETPSIRNVFKDKARPVVGVTVVGWTFPGKSNSDELYTAYLKSFACILDYVIRRYKCNVYVFNQVDDDLETADLLQGSVLEKDSLYIDRATDSAEILRSKISQSTVFIGTRFHSCIFSMMEGTPTIAISYLPKTEFIMKELGLLNRVIDIDDFDIVKAKKEVDLIFCDVDKARTDMLSKISLYRQANKNFARVIAEVIGSAS